MEEYLYLAAVIVLIFIVTGYVFKPKIEKKVQSVIREALAELNLNLVMITSPSYPDTGPFEHKYTFGQANIMASIMGLNPDYTTFRKLTVTNEEGVEKEYWIKIDFDILEFKGLEIKEMPT